MKHSRGSSLTTRLQKKKELEQRIFITYSSSQLTEGETQVPGSADPPAPTVLGQTSPAQTPESDPPEPSTDTLLPTPADPDPSTEISPTDTETTPSTIQSRGLRARKKRLSLLSDGEEESDQDEDSDFEPYPK